MVSIPHSCRTKDSLYPSVACPPTYSMVDAIRDDYAEELDLTPEAKAWRRVHASQERERQWIVQVMRYVPRKRRISNAHKLSGRQYSYYILYSYLAVFLKIKCSNWITIRWVLATRSFSATFVKRGNEDMPCPIHMSLFTAHCG